MYRVTDEEVIAVANALVEGTAIQTKLVGGKVGKKWLAHFKKRWGLDKQKMHPVDVVRAAWTTSANLRRYFLILYHTYVSAGVAKWNPLWSPTAAPGWPNAVQRDI